MSRDWRGRSAEPRRLGDTLDGFRSEVAPETVLAGVQTIWDRVVGERIASVTEVVEEKDGLVTVECSSTVWAQELELMAPRILSRLKSEMDPSGPEKLRFKAGS